MDKTASKPMSQHEALLKLLQAAQLFRMTGLPPHDVSGSSMWAHARKLLTEVENSPDALRSPSEPQAMTNEVKAAVERAADRIQTASEGPTGTGIFASEAIEIILAELAALPEQRPVAWMDEHGCTCSPEEKVVRGPRFDIPLYASPVSKEPGEAWQPIATAPKTGEHILVAEFDPARIGFGFCGGKKQSMMTVVHWWDNPGEEGWYASVDSQGENPFPATHWKPLEELET